MSHSPLPWHRGKSHNWIYTEATEMPRVILSAEPDDISIVSDADMDFICKCANSHYALIEALGEALGELEGLHGWLSGAIDSASPSALNVVFNKLALIALRDDLTAAIDKAKGAL